MGKAPWEDAEKTVSEENLISGQKTRRRHPSFFLCSAGASPRRRNVMSDLLGVNISKQVAAFSQYQ
jgi:hypothetical protein